MTLAQMYQRMNEAGYKTYDYEIGMDAVTIKHNGEYAVFVDPDCMGTVAEEFCAVAHEWGHCETGTTHSLYSPYDLIVQHENRANRWAAHHILPVWKIKKAMQSGYTEAWQIADYYNLTEDFVRDAIRIYLCEGKL